MSISKLLTPEITKYFSNYLHTVICIEEYEGYLITHHELKDCFWNYMLWNNTRSPYAERPVSLVCGFYNIDKTKEKARERVVNS